MPILYSTKTNNTMINVDLKVNMSQADALDVIMYQPQYSFTQEQAARLVFLVKRYIDPNQQSCAACGSSLRTAKDKIIKLYAAQKTIIDEIAAGIQAPVVAEQPVETQVVKKKSTKKK